MYASHNITCIIDFNLKCIYTHLTRTIKCFFYNMDKYYKSNDGLKMFQHPISAYFIQP